MRKEMNCDAYGYILSDILMEVKYLKVRQRYVLDSSDARNSNLMYCHVLHFHQRGIDAWIWHCVPCAFGVENPKPSI